MGILNWLSGLFGDDSSGSGIHDNDIGNSTHDMFDNSSMTEIDTSWDDNAINPANGLPMVGGTGGIDVEGNPYGTDFSHDDTFGTGSSIDDSFSNGFDDSFSSMDDSFSSGSSFDDW